MSSGIDIFGLTSLILGPVLGVVAAIIASRATKKASNDEVAVSSTEAATNQFRALTEGYTETFRQMKLQIQDMDHRMGEQEARITELEKANSDLVEKDTFNTQERKELLAYLESIKKLVPDPPGIPIPPRLWTT